MSRRRRSRSRVDLVVLLGEFVELDGGHVALGGELAEDVPAAYVFEVERLGERGGGRTLSAARWSGDGQ